MTSEALAERKLSSEAFGECSQHLAFIAAAVGMDNTTLIISG